MVDLVDCPECNGIEDEDCEAAADLASYDVSPLAGRKVQASGLPAPGTLEYRILVCAVNARDKHDQALTLPDLAHTRGFTATTSVVLKALAHRLKKAKLLASPARAMYEPTSLGRWWVGFQDELARKT
jgi:hypothetical protein